MLILSVAMVSMDDLIILERIMVPEVLEIRKA